MVGNQGNMVDTAVLLLLEGGDLRLPRHPRAVLKDRLQLHVGAGHRNDFAGDGQHMAHLGNRLLKGACHSVEGGQEQIAEGLPRQGALGEAVGQQLLHDGLGVGQGFHTVADIPRRGHPQVLAQPPGAAPVVGHGDDGGEVPGISFQSPQQGGQPRPAADGDDFRAPLPLLEGGVFRH